MADILLNLIPFLVSSLSALVLIIRRLYFYRKLRKGYYRRLPAEIPEYPNALSTALDISQHGSETRSIRKPYSNRHRRHPHHHSDTDSDSDDEDNQRSHSTLFRRVVQSPVHHHHHHHHHSNSSGNGGRLTLFAENILEINSMINNRNEIAHLCQVAGCIIACSSHGMLIHHALQYHSVWGYATILSTMVFLQVLNEAPLHLPLHQRIVIVISYICTLIDTILYWTRYEWQFTSRKHVFISLPLLGAQIAIIGLLLVRQLASSTEEGRVATLEEAATLLDSLTFGWITPLIAIGKKRVLTDTDMWELMPGDRTAEAVGHYFNRHNRSLLYNLLMTFYKQILQQCLYVIFWCGFVFVTPLSLQLFLRVGSSYHVWIYVAGLFFGDFIATSIQQQNTVIGQHISLRVKAILSHEICQKGLRRQVNISQPVSPVSSSASSTRSSFTQLTSLTSNFSDVSDTAEWSTGAVTNLLNVDVQNIGEALNYLHVLIGSMLQVAITIVFLWTLIGWATLVGLAVFALLLTLSNMVMTRLTSIYEVLYEATDKRLSMLSEMLHSIRMIKYLAWEDRFCRQILKARSKELQVLWRRHLMFVYIATSVYGGPMLITCVSLGAYALGFNQPLSPSLAFTTMILFNSLRSAMSQLPDMLFWVLQCRVSGKRIEDFFAEPEIPASSDYFSYSGHQRRNDRIGIVNGEFRWSNASSNMFYMGIERTRDTSGFTLRNINVEFQIGKLNVIAGPIGSGKTSLLLALLGEMPCTGGQVFLPRRKRVLDDAGSLGSCIAYVAQQVWLQNVSIRDNILFGQSYDSQRYIQVVYACGLERDLESLDAGDATQVGDVGAMLANGLRQRIAIARAVYSHAKHVIMDDCLSALDASTAKHIMDKCILGPLMRDRTCILVTHHVDMGMHDAAFAGRVVEQGPASEVLIKALLLYDDASISIERTSSFVNSVQQPSFNVMSSVTAGAPSVDNCEIESNALSAIDNQDFTYINGRFVDSDEAYAEGGISRKLEWRLRLWMAIILVYMLYELMFAIQNYWLSVWTDKNSTVEYNGLHFLVYFILTLLVLLLIGLPHFLTYLAALRASYSLHERLILGIKRATITFIGKTPVGRIMNRFSTDINSIDQDLPTHLFFLISGVGDIVFQLGVIAAVLPKFLPISLIIGKLLQQKKRHFFTLMHSIHLPIDFVCRGITTIRAFGMQKWFTAQTIECIDAMNRPVYLLGMSTQWMLNLIGWIASFVVLFTAIFIVIYHSYVSASVAGYIMSYALMFSESASYVVQNYSKTEITMNSVERILEYSNIEQESPEIIDNNRPPDDWPMYGNLSVEHLFVQYAPNLSPVIRDVTFTVYPGERVGIVGRTGAGKSTLSAALFRFIEAMAGKIIIDNIDISQIGLHDLRSRLTIVPQNLMLFSGTIRSNLDPFSRHSDHEIWNALRRCHLSSISDEMARPINISHLDAPVTENGDNLSRDQRQLLALARALLRNSKLIVLDEATSNADFDTDNLVQQMVRKEFTQSTILCIAHRLRSIIEFDRVLVLGLLHTILYKIVIQSN
ncbi:hypothetical protein BDF22DRAFT_672557 [Syncephalis plumigaleata]|nr:hypothetical protein BDF22DRAFT_672557 [Syncephalis plumigaleata]